MNDSEEMHPYYTLIPLRSYNAFMADPAARERLRHGTFEIEPLDALLCALIVDPDEAEDAAEEWDITFPHAFADFVDEGPKMREILLQTLQQYLMFHSVAIRPAWKEAALWDIQTEQWRRSLSALYQYSPRVFTWCTLESLRPIVNALTFDPDQARRVFRMLEQAVRRYPTNQEAAELEREDDEMLGSLATHNDIIDNDPSVAGRNIASAQKAAIMQISDIGRLFVMMESRQPTEIVESVAAVNLFLGPKGFRGRPANKNFKYDREFRARFAAGCLTLPG
mgnify:CR=1 FL=1